MTKFIHQPQLLIFKITIWHMLVTLVSKRKQDGGYPSREIRYGSKFDSAKLVPNGRKSFNFKTRRANINLKPYLTWNKSNILFHLIPISLYVSPNRASRVWTGEINISARQKPKHSPLSEICRSAGISPLLVVHCVTSQWSAKVFSPLPLCVWWRTCLYTSYREWPEVRVLSI